MPSITVDPMNNAGPWSAFAPDGVTPSTELALVIDALRPRPSADPSAGRVSGTDKALNHSLRRNMAALNLTDFDELRLWINSDRLADGSLAHPFFLEMTLASAAVAFDVPANTWRRNLPVSQVGVWEPVRLSISDLPAPIRSAVTQVRLRCLNAGKSFQCYVDDIIAVREKMIADVDAALAGHLHNALLIGGNPVPAVLHPATGVPAPVPPFFVITHYDIVYSREQTYSARPRGDFTGNKYSMRPQSNAYDLYYQITAEAADRPSQSQMLEFVLRTLPPYGELLVNGFLLPMESVVVPPFDQTGKLQTDTIPLFYKILTRQEVGSPDLVSAAQSVIIDGDLQSL